MNDYECKAQNNPMKVGFLFQKKPKTITKQTAAFGSPGQMSYIYTELP